MSNDTLTIESVLEELSTPEFAYVGKQPNAWKFKQPVTYAEARQEEKREKEFVEMVMKRMFPPQIQDLLPADIDRESARMIYIFHKRCVDRPGAPGGDEPAVTISQAIQLLSAPQFCIAVDGTLNAYRFNATARALEAEVLEVKNDSSESPST